MGVYQTVTLIIEISWVDHEREGTSDSVIVCAKHGLNGSFVRGKCVRRYRGKTAEFTSDFGLLIIFASTILYLGLY